MSGLFQVCAETADPKGAVPPRQGPAPTGIFDPSNDRGPHGIHPKGSSPDSISMLATLARIEG